MNKSVIIVTATTAITLFSALALFVGFKLGRATLPTIIERPQSREIISITSNSVTNSTSSLSVGSTHWEGFSTHAFAMVGIRMESILESVTGTGSHHYHAYLLPESNGFRIIVHHDTLTARLTDAQYDDLTRRVESALRDETERWASKP